MAARQLRLIGAAAVGHAIRKSGVHLFAAEVEIGFTGVAHRQRQMRSLRSSRLVFSAISALGLAGTSRRGGAGGIGAC